MKKILFSLFLSVLSAAAANSFQNGINDLSKSNVVQASSDFAGAVAAAPAEPDANFYYAMTRMLALPTLPAGGGFLNQLGVPAAGRNIYDWTAALPRTASGKLKAPIGMNVDAFTGQIRTNILAALIAAQTNLAQITDTNFTLGLSNDVTHFGDVTIDYGDVLMLRSLADTAEVFGYTLYSWNLNANIGSISNVIKADHSLEAVLTNFPQTFTFATTNDRSASRTAFSNAVVLYLAASDFIRHRAPDSTFLFNIETNELASEGEFRGTLTNLLASLDGTAQPLSPNSRYKVSMAAFFSDSAAPRAFFPQFAPGGAFEWNSWPDVTLGGLVTGLNETNLDKFAIKSVKAKAEYTAAGWAVNLIAPIDQDTEGNANPVAVGADGTLYGTAPYGGDNSDGVVFKVAPNASKATILYTFGSQSDDGSDPNGLIMGKDGNLYGTTQGGGLDGGGTFFKLTPSGQLTNLYQFGEFSPFGAANPAAALVQGSDGYLYGTTSSSGNLQPSKAPDRAQAKADGGKNSHSVGLDVGTFFRVSVTGQMEIFPSFFVPYACVNPSEPLIQGNDGNLYGVSDSGGTNGYGGVFEITTNGQFTQLYSFGAEEDPDFGTPLDGGYPIGPLLLASDGSFYGTTAAGGANDIENLGDGTLFRITINGGSVTFNTLVSFDSQNYDGYSPFGALVQDGENILGTTSNGGADHEGEIFEYAPQNDGAAALYWFDNSNVGEYQQFFAFYGAFDTPGGLTQGPNGAIYGTTSFGGNGGNAGGTVFKLSADQKPSISFLSPSLSAALGSTVNLNVQAIGPSLSYQWFFKFLPITAHNVSGATNSTLTISDITTANAGGYTVIVRNSFGSVTSSVVSVTADVPPSYTKEPVNLTMSPGGAAVFSAAATNASSYQWNFNSNPLSDGGNISGSQSNVLTINPVTTANAGSYQLAASNAFGSTNSTIVRLTVPVEAGKPVVTILKPVIGARSNSITFSGTVSDSVRVAGVSYAISNLNVTSDVQRASAVLSTGKGSSNWTFTPTHLSPGTNILMVTGSNYSGRTSTATRAFFFRDTAPFTLSTNPAGYGTITGRASFAGDSAPSNNANLYVGEGYTLTATPAAHAFFLNWSTSNGHGSTNRTFSFTMENGLSVQANFTTNNFIGMAGRYDGIFTGSGGTNSGLIGNLRLGTNGMYSGTLYLAGKSYPIHGSFDVVSNQAAETVARPNASGSNVALTLSMSSVTPPRIISGSVQSKGWSETNFTLIAAQTNLQANSYTMLFQPNADLPPGYGYALITNHNGVLSLGGALADGSTFTQSSALGEDGQFPIYASLYTGGGLLLGRVNPTNSVNPAAQWIKPPAKSGAFASGFNSTVTPMGSQWSRSEGAYTNLVASEPNLAISGAGLSLEIDAILTDPTNFTAHGEGINLSHVTINPANGLLSVVFTNDLHQRVTGFGALLPDITNGGGYYVGTTNDGVFTLKP